MIDNPDNNDLPDSDDVQITVIDKIDILLSLIEKGFPKDAKLRYQTLTELLLDARFQLLHSWNEIEYYMELCEAYEKQFKEIGDKLK